MDRTEQEERLVDHSEEVRLVDRTEQEERRVDRTEQEERQVDVVPAAEMRRMMVARSLTSTQTSSTKNNIDRSNV